MASAALELILSLKDEASRGLSAIRSALGGVADAAGGAAGGFADFFAGAAQFAVGGLIQKGIEGIAGSIGDLKAGMIDGNAEFERYQTQFGVLLGGADAAKQRLSDLAAFGASTPFELPEVVVADKILQSFGLHAVDAAKRFGFAGEQIRTIAGDVAAGTGAGFDEISTYIGKFASGATGEAIARFQELGIVTKAELTRMGLAFDKGGSLIINSQADLDRATGILLQSMQGKFGGMMAAQSGTFEGMISNLQDWKAGTLRIIGVPIFDALKVQLQGLLAWLPTQQPRIEAFAQSLAGGIAAAIPRILEAGRVLLDLGRYVAALVSDGDPLNDWLSRLPAGMQGVVEVGGRLVAAMMGMGAAVGGVLQSGWAWLTGAGLPAARAGFEALAGALSGPLASAWGWLTGTGLPALQAGWSWLTDTGIPAARAGFESLSGALSGPLTAAWSWLTGTGLPALQTGWGWLVDTGLPMARAGFDELSGRITAGLQPALDWLQGTGLPAVQAGLTQLRDLMQPLLDAVQPVIDGFKEGGLAGALQAIPGVLPDALAALSNLRTELSALALEGLGGLLERAAELPQLSEGLAALGLSGPAIEGVTGTLRTLGDILSTVGGWVRDVGAWVGEQLLPPLLAFGASVAETVAPHLARLGEIFSTTVMPILQDFGSFIGGNLPGLISVLSPLITGLIDNGLSILELALRAIGATWETWLKPAFEAIGQWLADLTGGWENLARGAERLQGTLTGVAQAIRDIAAGKVDFSQIFSGLQNLASGQIQIPGFAGGVSNFGGGLAMVGERGPELVRLPGGSDVIPAGAFGGGGGQSINVVVNVSGSVATERDLVESIRSALIGIGRNNVTSGVP